MAATLNRGQLPSPYFAEARVKLGRSVEIVVATLDEGMEATSGKIVDGVAVWAPPKPLLRTPLPAAAPDLIEVQVFDGSEGPRLVAAIELVSPANKDRPAHRHGFAVKCASYLHEGIGLVVVDVVTERHTGLHRDVLDLLGVAPAEGITPEPDLYAAAYRTVAAEASLDLEVWLETLALGAALPTVPLWISPELCLPLDLEATCEQACAARRIA